MKYFKYNPIEGDLDVAFDDDLKLKKIQLDTTATPATSAPGLIQWNAIDGTYDMGLLNSSVLQVGQETIFYGKASGAIANGDLCQFAGVQGDHILMKKAVGAEIEANPHFLIGVATENISNGNFGYVTWFGKINGIYTKTPANQDSVDWLAGDILYFNVTTGQLTKTMPSVPNRIITVAAVIKEQTGASENGIILVRPTFGIKLQDLDDVNGTPLTTTGQIPVWNQTGGYFDFDKNLITEYVPYTGALYDVNLNSKNLAGVNTLSVAQTTTNAVIVGEVTGNTRGLRALDIQSDKIDGTWIASGIEAVAVGVSNMADGDGAVAVGGYNYAMGYNGVAVGTENSGDVKSFLFGFQNEGLTDGAAGTLGELGCAFGGSNVVYGKCFGAGFSNTSYSEGAMSLGVSNINLKQNSILLGNSLFNMVTNTTRIGKGGSNEYMSYASTGLVTKNSDTALEQIHSTGNVLATDYSTVGAEKIANGTFTGSAASWTVGSFAYSSNKIAKTAGGTTALSQASGSMTTAPVIGEYYLFQFTYDSGSSLKGTLIPSVAGVTLDTIGIAGKTIFKRISKTFSYIIKATATTGPAFTPSDDCRVETLDNITLKRITGGDLKAIGGIKLEMGAAASTCGTAVLVAGTKVVNTTAVTANSVILLTSQVDGGTVGFQRVTAKVAGTSFTITSSSATDTSTIGWLIINPI